MLPTTIRRARARARVEVFYPLASHPATSACNVTGNTDGLKRAKLKRKILAAKIFSTVRSRFSSRSLDENERDVSLTALLDPLRDNVVPGTKRGCLLARARDRTRCNLDTIVFRDKLGVLLRPKNEILQRKWRCIVSESYEPHEAYFC